MLTYKLGRFVAITNVRNLSSVNANIYTTSRGLIPLVLLKQEKFDPSEWKHVIKSLDCQNFNVLFGDLSQKDPEIYIYSSETDELTNISDKRIHSLANNDLQRDKQDKGVELINSLISSNSLNESSIFSVLQ